MERGGVGQRPNLTVSGAVFFHSPASLHAERLEDFIVVAVLGQLVVSIETQAGEDLSCNGAPAALSPLVVLSFLPGGQARPGRHIADLRTKTRGAIQHLGSMSSCHHQELDHPSAPEITLHVPYTIETVL